MEIPVISVTSHNASQLDNIPSKSVILASGFLETPFWYSTVENLIIPNWPLQYLNLNKKYDLTKHLKSHLSHPTEDQVIIWSQNINQMFFSKTLSDWCFDWFTNVAHGIDWTSSSLWSVICMSQNTKVMPDVPLWGPEGPEIPAYLLVIVIIICFRRGQDRQFKAIFSGKNIRKEVLSISWHD